MRHLVRSFFATLACFVVVAQGSPADAAPGQIPSIGPFLERCPQNDPAYAQIRADFQLRRNGALVGSVGCSEPISAMPVAQYTDELLVLQGLRVMYYMDRGATGHLPWTPGTLYDWMRSRIGGIDISDAGWSYCCVEYGSVRHIVVGAQDDFNREFDKRWRGIAGNIDLYAHEARHADGFPHSSCCGITGGCDDAFSEDAAMPPYGIQWFLNRAWLTGDINVGFSCLPAAEATETANWHLVSVNSVFRDRFCAGQPAIVPMPAAPGGPCLQTQLCFYTVTPCRVFDSRDPGLGGPAPLIGGSQNAVPLAGHCGVPTTAAAVSLNVTVTGPTVQGHLRLFPSGAALPVVSTINYVAGQTRANNAVTRLGASGTLEVYVGQSGGSVHVIVDVNGYFE